MPFLSKAYAIVYFQVNFSSYTYFKHNLKGTGEVENSSEFCFHQVS